MTEELLERFYRIKEENGYLTRSEIIARDYEWEMNCLNEAMKETYNYVWVEIIETFMKTKQDVKKEFKIVNLSDYPSVLENEYFYDKRYYDFVRLSKVYNKHICFIRLDGKHLFFSLEDLMEKLTKDGISASYRVVTRFGILSLVLSENKIEEYLNEATRYKILKRATRF